MSHSLIHADLLAYLRGNRWLVQNGYIPKAHAVLCDPPYGLEFMGKEWDRPKPSGLWDKRDPHAHKRAENKGQTASPYISAQVNKYVAGEDFQAWVSEWAGLLLDYVHPGALGLFFGGTRTYHRLAAGLEDAGWEIADCIMWVHGQGFPKSAALDKLLDKEAGAIGTLGGYKSKDHAAQRKPGSERLHEGWQRPWMEDEEKRDAQGRVYLPATPLAARWQGYGTALKPAYEPVIVARAPRGKRTYAALAREFGTGALAIDAARIGTDAITTNGWGISRQAVYNAGSGLFSRDTLDFRGAEHSGRWPANFGLVCACESDNHAPDCPVRVLGAQSGETGNRYRANPSTTEASDGDLFWGKAHSRGERGHDDTGTAARFFYQAKAAAWEREAGLHHRTRKIVNDGRSTPIDNPFQRGDTQRLNTHPTLKPIKLAEYLARLILPPEGDEPRRLLVPFAGSGSEMIGALLAGWDVVTGIEREAEYVELARARVGWWAQFATYDEARAAYEKERKSPPAPVVIEDEKPTQQSMFGEIAS